MLISESAGNDLKNDSIDASPPAEAPIPTTGKTESEYNISLSDFGSF